MKAMSLWIAAGAMLAAGTMAAAQDRNWRGGADRGDRSNRGDWHRGGSWPRYHSYYPRHYSYAPYFYPRYSYYPRYFYPYAYWPPVYYSYSVPLYEPPVVVERIYERGPMYEAPRQYSYQERSQAQVTPPTARPSTPVAPRLERQTLSARELFDFDKATLRMPQPKLDEIAQAMKRNPQINNVRVTGYTDRLGSDEYNMKLSKRRADAVKSYLAGKGVEASRLVAIGKGEANPVVECKQANRAELIKCLEPNRRVEVEQITVEKKTSG